MIVDHQLFPSHFWEAQSAEGPRCKAAGQALLFHGQAGGVVGHVAGWRFPEA